jgi:hypothetical protein
VELSFHCSFPFLFRRYSLSCREGEGESCTGDQAATPGRTKDKRLGQRWERWWIEKQNDRLLIRNRRRWKSTVRWRNRYRGRDNDNNIMKREGEKSQQ